MALAPVGSPPRIAGGLTGWFTVDPAGTFPAYQTFGGAAALADGDPIGWVPGWFEGLPEWRVNTAGLRPLLKLAVRNGRRVARFDGVDDWIDTGVFAAAPRAWEAWIVCLWAGDVPTEQRAWSNPANSLGISRIECDPLAAVTTFSTCQQQFTHAVDSGDEWHMWRYVSDPGASFAERDGVVVASQGAAPYMPLLSPTRWRLGSDYAGGTVLDGDIAEFVGVPYRLSESQATRLRSWLTGRWGPF